MKVNKIGLCIFVWVFFMAIDSSLANNTPNNFDTVSGQKDRTRWQVSIKSDPVEDTTDTSFTLPSDDASASIGILCTSNYKFGDGHRGVSRQFFISTDKYIAPNSEMTIRLDKNPALHKSATVSDDYKAMVINDLGGMRNFYKKERTKFPEEETDFSDFIPQLLGAKTVLIKLEIFQAAPVIWSFSPEGADMRQIKRTCEL